MIQYRLPLACFCRNSSWYRRSTRLDLSQFVCCLAIRVVLILSIFFSSRFLCQVSRAHNHSVRVNFLDFFGKILQSLAISRDRDCSKCRLVFTTVDCATNPKGDIFYTKSQRRSGKVLGQRPIRIQLVQAEIRYSNVLRVIR